jgi:hypothetical protein
MSMTKQLLESVYERRKQQDNEFKQAEFEYYYGQKDILRKFKKFI